MKKILLILACFQCLCLPAVADSFFAAIEAKEVVLELLGDEAEAVIPVMDELISSWVDYAEESGGHFPIDKVLQAMVDATAHHAGQYRKAEHVPYIIHPLRVCRNLWDEAHVRAPDVIIAALLHDSVEDTSMTLEDLEAKYGKGVALIVNDVTNDPNLDSEANKQRQVDHAPYLSVGGKLVKLADRLDNLRDLYRNPPPSWSQEKVDGYYAWGEKLLEALRGVSPTLEQGIARVVAAHGSGHNEQILPEKASFDSFHQIVFEEYEADPYDSYDVFVLDSGWCAFPKWYEGFYPRVGEIVKVLSQGDFTIIIRFDGNGNIAAKWLFGPNGEKVWRAL